MSRSSTSVMRSASTSSRPNKAKGETHIDHIGNSRSSTSTSSSSHGGGAKGSHSDKQVTVIAEESSGGGCLTSSKTNWKHKYPETCTIRAGLQCCDGAARYPIYHPHVYKGQTSYVNTDSTIYVLQSDYDSGTCPKWPGKVVIHDSNTIEHSYLQQQHHESISRSNSVDVVEFNAGMNRKVSVAAHKKGGSKSRSGSARHVESAVVAGGVAAGTTTVVTHQILRKPSSSSSSSSDERVEAVHKEHVEEHVHHEEHIEQHIEQHVVVHEEVKHVRESSSSSSHSRSTSGSLKQSDHLEYQAVQNKAVPSVSSRSFSKSASTASKAGSVIASGNNKYYDSYHDGYDEPTKTTNQQKGGILGCCQRDSSKDTKLKASPLPPATSAKLDESESDSSLVYAKKAKTKAVKNKSTGKRNICCSPSVDKSNEIQSLKTTKGHSLIRRASSSSSCTSSVSVENVAMIVRQESHKGSFKNESHSKHAAKSISRSSSECFDQIEVSIEKKKKERHVKSKTSNNKEDALIYASTAAVAGSQVHHTETTKTKKSWCQKGVSTSSSSISESASHNDAREAYTAIEVVDREETTKTTKLAEEDHNLVALYSMAEPVGHHDGMKKIVYSKTVEQEGCVSKTVDDQKWSDESYILVQKSKAHNQNGVTSSTSDDVLHGQIPISKTTDSQELITSRKRAIVKSRKIPVEGFSVPVGSTMIPANAFNDIYNGEKSSTSYILTGGDFKCFALKLVRKDNRIVTCMLWNEQKVVHKREKPGPFVVALFCDDEVGNHDCDRYLVIDSRMIKVSSVLNFPLTDKYKQSVSPRFYAKLAYLDSYDDISD